MHQPHSLCEVLFALLCGDECSFEVVDDREKLADQPALRPFARSSGLAGSALPVVLEIRLGAAREIQVLVPLTLGRGERILGLGLLLVAERLLLVRRILLAGGLTPLVT